MDRQLIEDLQTVSDEELEAAAELYDALLAASKRTRPQRGLPVTVIGAEPACPGERG